MSRPSSLGAVLMNTEASWADLSVSTFGTRLTVTNEVDVSKLIWTKFVPSRVTQYRNEITPECVGYLGGEFDLELALTGLGSTAAGTIALNTLMTFLGIVFGNAVAGRTGALLATAGGTPSALNVGVVNGTLAGALIRAGSLNDGRGGGQWAQAITHTTSVMTLLNEIPAALNAGDVIYNPCNVYPSEAPTATDITSTRFRFLTANQQYEARGCYPKKVVFSGLATGGEPKVKVTMGVSIWTEISVTFPDVATSLQTFPTCPIAGGSFFIAPTGTATRAGNTVPIRDFTLTYNLGIAELMGPGGGNANQSVVGCKRTQDTIMIEFIDDSEATTTTPKWRTKEVANLPHHFMYSMACADGSALALRSPYCVFTGPMPTQQNYQKLNRAKVQLKCGTDNTRATDLERAALILGIA